MEKNTIGNITWVNLVNPEIKDVRKLVEEHYIDASLGDEIISPSLRPHSIIEGDTIFISLQIPTQYHDRVNNKNRIVNKEVDFVIRPTSLVTARYTDLDIFDNFSKFFEAESILGKQSHLSGTKLFHEILIYLYKSLYDHLDQYRDALRASEKAIFRGKEKAMVIELSHIHQQLLRYQESLRYHEDIITELLEHHQEKNNEEDLLLLEEIQGEYERVIHGLATNISYLHELRDTNNSLLSIKQNETMQILTVMAYISLPASIIASVFGMNALHMPFIGHEYDFWILVLGMGLVSLSLFLFFRHKKLL